MSAITLSPDQQAVVDHDGHCLVVACPGSGKTRVIISKIEHILNSIPKSRVCAVTFTRDSAAELKKRLRENIDPEVVQRRSRVGTFHSLAIRQLRASELISKVATPAEQMNFVHRALATSECDLTLEEAVQIIETVKSSRSVVPEEDHPLYRAYASLLKRSNVDDLHDVLRKSLALMQQGVVSPYPVGYMLVDEFQDTDEVQLAWVLEHAKAGTKITVVGDDDQSVYSFRHALGYKGMDRFRQETGAKLITLGTNYRCKAEILSAAGQLIGHNKERIEKSLKAARGPGGSVQSLRLADRESEANSVMELIWKDVLPYPNDPSFKYTVPEGKWAVLARNRRSLDTVEHELQSRGIRYSRPPQESIWARQPYSVFLSFLRSLQTGDALGIDQVLHFAGFANEHIESLHSLMAPDLWKLLDAFLPPMTDFPDDVAKEIKSFTSLTSGWRRQLRRARSRVVILGVAEWFMARIRNDDERDLFAMVSASVSNLNGSLVQRVNCLTSLGNSEENKKGNTDTSPNTTGVALMTMHGSKGLEFNNVWIIAAEESVIPSTKNPVYDEERRLMYVAMTRAKDHLTMSSRVTKGPSPFVIESGYDPRSVA